MSYLEPGRINGLNLFAYCNDNPVMMVDSTGTSAWSDFCGWWGNFWNSSAGAISKVVIGVGIIAGVGIASLLTGGLAGIILGGAFWGGLAGGIFGAFAGGLGAMNGSETFGDVLSGMASGFLRGTISGAIVGGLTGGLGQISKLSGNVGALIINKAIQVVGGATIAGTAKALEGLFLGNFSWEAVGVAALVGGISGLFNFGFKSYDVGTSANSLLMGIGLSYFEMIYGLKNSYAYKSLMI